MPDSVALLALIFGSSLASSLFFVLSARILREAAGENAPSALGVVGITHVCAALFLLPFLPAAGVASFSEIGTMVPSSVLLLIVLTAVLHLAARFFHFRALSLTDVTLVSPFAALTPVLTVSTAWIILGERLGRQELGGVLIVVVSLLGLTGAANVLRSHVGIGSTLASDSAKAGLWFAFLSTIPPAFKIAIPKEGDPPFEPLHLCAHHALSDRHRRAPFLCGPLPSTGSSGSVPPSKAGSAIRHFQPARLEYLFILCGFDAGNGSGSQRDGPYQHRVSRPAGVLARRTKDRFSKEDFVGDRHFHWDPAHWDSESIIQRSGKTGGSASHCRQALVVL